MKVWLATCTIVSGALLYVPWTDGVSWGTTAMVSLSPLILWGIAAILLGPGSPWKRRGSRNRPEWDWPSTLEARTGRASPGVPSRSLMD